MKRIHYTVNTYGIKNTELVDGLSWWTIRNDWDPEFPASAIKNLREGKFKLIAEYKKLGIHIISEFLRYPVIGHLALVVDGPENSGWSWNALGGTDVPIMRIVYSKSIIYGAAGGDGLERDPHAVLLNNNRRGPWIAENTSSEEITNYYYLNFLPWTKLHALDVLSFERDKESVKMDLGNKSSVKFDHTKQDGFTAVYKGIKIMDGFSVTCPIDNNRIAFYSKTAKTLTYPASGLKGKNPFKAEALYDDRAEKFPYKIVNGNVEINVPAGRPVIFYH